MEYTLSKFEPSEAKQNCIWLLIGPRNTGKSVLLRDLLYHTHKHYDFGMAMTATVSTVDALKEIFPHNLIYTNGYDFAKGDQFLQTCKKLVEKRKKRNCLLVLDDCMFDNSVMKTETQKNLHLNGRHYNTTIFNTTQYSMIIPTQIRSNIDYVIALSDNITANRRKLFEYFFGMFPSYKTFDKIFAKVTENYGALVIDRTAKGTGNIQDSIKWYRASLHQPPFKIGKPIFFEMSKKHSQSRHRDKTQLSVKTN